MAKPVPDLRDMLLGAGIGQFNAILSIPYMNMLPGTTDPYAQGVMQLVRGLQRMLNQRGARLLEDGGMGEKTVQALAFYAGPRWQDKSWAQLYVDVRTGVKWAGWNRHGRSPTNRNVVVRSPTAGWDYTKNDPLGNALGDMLMHPVVLAAGGFFVWWKFFRKPARATSSSQKLLPAGDLEDL